MKKLFAQFMKFGVVGALAFCIDYGLLALLTEAFGVTYRQRNDIVHGVGGVQLPGVDALRVHADASVRSAARPVSMQGQRSHHAEFHELGRTASL